MSNWVPVVGYEGLYEVSDDGRIRNAVSGKDVAFSHVNGYRRVNLWKHNRYKTKRIHRLVEEAFIPNPERKSQVNHINGDKEDNRVANLEWSTPSENNLHAYRTGLNRPTCQNAVNARKRAVVVDGEWFESMTAAARHIGACVQTVQDAAELGRKAKGHTVEYAR